MPNFISIALTYKILWRGGPFGLPTSLALELPKKPSINRVNVKKTHSIFMVYIIKILNFFNIIILTVNDIFSVFILLRRKVRKFAVPYYYSRHL